MKKFIAIGLGNFGFSLAKRLEENGCEVLGIDTSRELVDKVKDYISHAVIGDASNKEVLQSLMLKDFDGAIVSIGQDMASSILVSLYLKEIGVKKIIVRAISGDHGKILINIGVDEVIYPETAEALRLANRLSMKNAIDYLPLGEDYSIAEVIPSENFIGKTLKELNITTRFNCQVIALKLIKPAPGDKSGKEISSIKIPPRADDIITKSTVMILIGRDSDIEKIQSYS
ncbi:MAG: TrkA family potassium uptake protein [Spirochaetes bacterium]|jgi:trk system potassium uptake protein TrkA|nr:TrkA family potassium uptake protein [Spirochaetota bacterium]